VTLAIVALFCITDHDSPVETNLLVSLSSDLIFGFGLVFWFSYSGLDIDPCSLKSAFWPFLQFFEIFIKNS
jgi:hypothetical protein